MRKYTTIWLLLLALTSSSQTNRIIDSLEQLILIMSDINRVLSEKAQLVTNYYTAGERQKAMELYNESMAQAQKLHSKMGLGALYHARGVLFYYESKFDSTLKYIEKALAIRKEINDTVGILKSTSNMGAIYYMLTDYKKALGYYEEALKKEAELHYPEGKYVSINNLGYIHAALKLNSKALYYFRKAEKIYKGSSKGELIYTYDGLYSVYKELGKNDSALYYAMRSKEVSEALGDKISLCYALTNIGILYNVMQRFAKAEVTLKEALKLSKELHDQRLEMSIYGNLAINHMSRNDMDTALSYVEKIEKIEQQLNIKIGRDDLSELFAEFYYKKKEYQKAYDELRLHEKYKDSIYNAQTMSQISEMQTKYETEKKEKENQLLQAENTTYRNTRNYLLIILVLALLTIAGAIIAYRKIKNSNTLLALQKKEISLQKEIVDEKQKEILDSIHYAKRIQFALLASDSLLQAHLPQHFVLFKPKDVVSGDFYWAASTADGFVYITADCTGHGVPGAFMSLLNISKLSQTINENKITRPDLVLNTMRSEIIKALNPADSREESKDGMDAVVCRLDRKNMILHYAAANNALYLVRNNELMTWPADKMPVGKDYNDTQPFTLHEIPLQEGDTIYTFTDGLADQFGGPRGKKFKYRQLEELLLAVHKEPMQQQKQKLEEAFIQWKGLLEQVDDICIIGVRI